MPQDTYSECGIQFNVGTLNHAIYTRGQQLAPCVRNRWYAYHKQERFHLILWSQSMPHRNANESVQHRAAHTSRRTVTHLSTPPDRNHDQT